MRSIHVPHTATFGLVVFGLTVSAACGDDSTRQPNVDADGAVPQDTGVDDLDDDGLCNATEEREGTDPSDPDSDDDGFTDGVEFLLGEDALSKDSPRSDSVVPLSAVAGENTTFRVYYDTRVAGTFSGAFMSSTPLTDPERTANTYFVDSAAAEALPAENVTRIDADNSRFEGAEADTTLVFELRFTTPADEKRVCTTAYPFTYAVKTGTDVDVRPFVLVLVPPGKTLTEDTWCRPTGPCR